LSPSARDRLRRYFEQHVGEIVDKDELAQVAGIHEWARRVRELRDDDGAHRNSPEMLIEIHHP